MFSASYATNALKFMKQKGDSFEFNGVASLKDKRVGTVRGYGYGDAFSKNPDFTRDDAPDLVTNVRKLVAKRVDLTLEDELVARAILSKEDPKLLDQIEFTKGALSSNPLYIASGLKNPRHKEIIDAFNKGYSSIKGDGTLDKILNKYGLSK